MIEVADADKLAHENEAPFQLPLAEWFIRSFCPHKGIVCDPFCGSGTTAHAAIRLGRQYAMFDIRDTMVGLTKRRVAAAQAELSPYAEI